MHNICECVYKSYKFLPYSSILIQFRFIVIHDMACMRLSLSVINRLEGSEDGVGTRDGDSLLLLKLHKMRIKVNNSSLFTHTHTKIERYKEREMRTYTEVSDLEVIDDQSETGGTDTQSDTGTGEVDSETELLGPVGVGVRESDDLVFETEGLGPTAHDERIIGGDNGDEVNTLALELIEFLEVRGEVVNVACGLWGMSYLS